MKEWFVGIDLGGTSVKLALANGHGDLVRESSIPTQSEDGPVRVLERISDEVQGLLHQEHAVAQAIGMGVPGLADIKEGATKFLPNLETQWKDIAVAQYLSDRHHCPVRLLNDVRSATLAELKFGHGKENPNISLAFFALGTGIGGGIALDGKLHLGPLGAAGELGHQTILPEGPRCGCGNRGCLETVASGTAIAAEGRRLMAMGLAPKLHQLVDGKIENVTSKLMKRAADEGDHAIEEAIVQAGKYIGHAAANVVTILHPELIVLGGGVAEIGDLLTNTVKTEIVSRVGMFPVEDIRVERSLLGEKAGVMGAIALAIMCESEKITN